MKLTFEHHHHKELYEAAEPINHNPALAIEILSGLIRSQLIKGETFGGHTCEARRLLLYVDRGFRDYSLTELQEILEITCASEYYPKCIIAYLSCAIGAVLYPKSRITPTNFIAADGIYAGALPNLRYITPKEITAEFDKLSQTTKLLYGLK